MALPVIEYATNLVRDLDANRPAADLPKDVLIEATRLSVAEHNAEVQAVVNMFATPTTDRETELDEWAEAEMQPLDELGEPQPIKGKRTIELGFPIDDMGIRFDLSFKASKMITIQEFSDRVAQIQHADANTMNRKLLSALFSNVSRSHKEDGKPTQTIKFLANNDSDTYATMIGGAATTANHYRAQASDISDANNPYTAIEEALTSRLINRPPYVAFIPPGLVAATKLLDGFAPTNAGAVAVDAQPTTVLQTTLAAQGVALPATMQEIGGIGQLHIVQYNRLPAGYIIGAALGDPMRRPLKFRQYPRPDLQGLVAVPETNEFPYFKNRFLRFYGFGGYNRVGAIVYLIGSSTYTIPAGYDAPFGK